MTKILCVAEKPSMSKALTQILAGGQLTTRNSTINYVKNYDFAYPQLRAHVTFTCVAGHLMAADFGQAHRPWASCDPFALFEAPIERYVEKDKKAIATNLEREARGAQKLIIWTDCDREGEAIGKEISDICRKVNARIEVKRARFSAVIAAQIHNAMQHPVALDLAQAAAVDARILLDLRIGAAFTRMQSKALWGQVAQCNEQIISYGPCQFPTLGFVVARFNQVRAFVPEKFWYIHLALIRPDDTTHEDIETVFTWRRGHLFDMPIAVAIYEGVLDDTLARVVEVKKKDVKKWKPLPLTTVELQKAGSRLLKLSPKKILDIAEKLYQDGFLSYPRTETDQYDPAFDFKPLIEKQTVDPAWGGFAAQLNNTPGKFGNPRRGKHDDHAHPPIHPTAHAGNLHGDDARVYAFVTRRFLASCSLDAVGHETSVKVEYGGEEFTASGLVVLERNYLDVYTYDKWEGRRVPEFREGETFVPSVCELKEGETTSPKYLTEADLVGLMDKNGIGTDATIADHIAKVVDREYVVRKPEGGTVYLVPSRLGMGLVDGYNSIDFDRSLSKPQLRRMTERSMVEVCQGTKTKADMLTEALEQYQDMYVRARANFARVVDNVKRYLDAPGAAAGNAARGGRGGGRGARGGRGGRGGGGGAGRGNGGGGSDDDSDGGGGAPARGRGRGRARARAAAPASRGRAAPPPPPPPLAPAPAPAPITIDDNDDEDYWAAIDDIDTQPAPPPPKPPSAPVRKPLSALAPKPPSIAAPRPKPASTIKPLSTYNPPAASYANQNANSQASSSRLPPPPPGDENPIYCMCGAPARVFTVVKEGPNKGRGFWKCARPREGPEPQCNFFQWADEDGAGGGGGGGGYSAGPSAGGAGAATVPAKRRFEDTGSQGGRRCECDLTAVRRTSQKEGPNKGRDFWACPSSKSAQCGFFEWDDQPAGAWAGDPTGGGGGVGGAGGGGGEAKSGGCFKCGQEGHWSSACPNAQAGGAGAGRSQGGGGTQTGTCFKCGEPGHWSSACPNPDGGGGGGFKRNKTMPSASGASASAECFKCHQTGHYSRDCPNEGGGSSSGSGRGRGRGKSRGAARSGSGSFSKRGRGRGKGTGRGKSKSSGAGKFGSMEDFYL